MGLAPAATAQATTVATGTTDKVTAATGAGPTAQASASAIRLGAGADRDSAGVNNSVNDCGRLLSPERPASFLACQRKRAAPLRGPPSKLGNQLDLTSQPLLPTLVSLPPVSRPSHLP